MSTGGDGGPGEVSVFNWEESEDSAGKRVAKLCGTEVVVRPADAGSPAPWKWEVHFADGQVQSGHAGDQEGALEKGKKVAERFLA
jgi:hypothetical protein